MTAAARQLAPESEDPRNAILDLVEHAIASGLAMGLGPQIEARCRRMLPPPPPAADAGDLWEASVIVTALIECRRKIKSPATAAQIEIALGFAKTRFEAAKAANGGSQP